MSPQYCTHFQFHQRHSIPLEENYAVAPHHTGAYPIYQPLVDCWRDVWNVTITSSEEYPHLRPAYARQGFIFDGLRVLPRSLCELFTHTIYYDQFPKGGPERFEKLGMIIDHLKLMMSRYRSSIRSLVKASKVLTKSSSNDAKFDKLESKWWTSLSAYFETKIQHFYDPSAKL